MVDEDYAGDSGKLEDVSFKLCELVQEGHKVLVFSQFVKQLKIVEEMLNNLSIKYAYLDGSTKDRQAEVKSFQEDSNIQVFLISLKAGGVGLNLTAADYVFMLDPWWNPAIEAQAIDRAHRIGQDKTVMIYKFISKDTIEEKILLLQQSKKKLISDLIVTEESFMKNLTKHDIAHLLQ
jgi:SNF2 family DNA or RNA helicase